MPRPTSKPLLSISVAFMLTAVVPPGIPANGPQVPLARHDAFDSLPDGAVARLGTGNQTPPDAKPGHSIRQIAFSPDGRRLAVRGEPGDPRRPRQIHVYDAQTGKPLRTLDGPARPLTELAFAAGGDVILAGTADDPDGIYLWSRHSERPLRTIPAGRGPLAVLPGGRQVAVLAPFRTSDMVRIHDVATGNEVQRFVIPITHRFQLAPDGRTYLATSRLDDAELRIVELATANETQRLKGHTHPPTAAIFSPDARTVVASDEAVILVWEIATGRTVHRLAGHKGRVRALAFSPDGRWLASGGDDRTVRIWELATGREVHRFDGHAGGIASLAFSPGGDRLASGSLDRTALVWNFTVARRSNLPSGPLGEPQLAQLWTDLADTQPAKAYYAAGLIAHLEEQVVPFLRQNVESQLVPVQRERIEQLVRELDDDDWIVRFDATKKLKRLRDAAFPVLQQTLRQTASAEVRQRVRRILAQADQPRFSDADVRRLLRLIQAVEPLEIADAAAILQRLARDFPHAEVVKEAQRALQRRRAR